MDIFQEVQKLVSEELRKDADRKIDYLLTGKIPNEFQCPNCRERLNPETRLECHNCFEIEKAWGEPLIGSCPKCDRKIEMR